MKRFSLVFSSLLAAVFLVAGCTNRGPGTPDGDGAKKLTLKAPADASLTQGETATINVVIAREKFNEPVTLKFTGLPEGVTIVENDPTIAKDATSAKLTLRAAADAKVMDSHAITITGAGGGMTQEATFKVSVKKKG